MQYTFCFLLNNRPIVTSTMDPPSFKKSQLDNPPSTSQTGLTPTYSAFSTTFASLSLHQSDRIRLLKFPDHDIAAIRQVIKTSWPFGLQNERVYGPSHEFKLYSNPWYGQSKDAVPSRVIMREILAYLFKVGWILHASVDISKKELDKDTLVFRKQATPPPESEWISISFNQSDRLRLIGADEVLIRGVRELLVGMRRLQSECWKDRALVAWEFKVLGTPWRASGEETMVTRGLMLGLLQVLEGEGWSLYASFDQSMSPGDHVSETDSWYCVREKGWVKGSTVFHR